MPTLVDSNVLLDVLFLEMFDFLIRKYLRYGCSKSATPAPK